MPVRPPVDVNLLAGIARFAGCRDYSDLVADLEPVVPGKDSDIAVLSASASVKVFSRMVMAAIAGFGGSGVVKMPRLRGRGFFVVAAIGRAAGIWSRGFTTVGLGHGGRDSNPGDLLAGLAGARSWLPQATALFPFWPVRVLRFSRTRIRSPGCRFPGCTWLG